MPMIVGMTVMIIVMMMIMLMATVFVRGLDDTESCGRDASLHDMFGLDVCARRQQAPQGGAQLLKRQAGIQECAQNHVARSAREAVEVENSHDPWSRSCQLAVCS